jgi:hypothetical protein
MRVDVHCEDGIHIVEDTLPASMTLLRRLEDELHLALVG